MTTFPELDFNHRRFLVSPCRGYPSPCR